MITPELPRAPMSEPWATAPITAPRSSAGASSSSSAETAAWAVMDMFVPVSPSGTGNTLRRLSASRWSTSASRKPITTARRPTASRWVATVTQRA